MKIWNKLIVGFFALCLTLMFLSNIFIPAKSFSDQENRYLTQLPTFSVKTLINGQYTKKFEEFIQDQFIGRDKWILLKTELEKLSGKKENNGVYFGKDDWYFEVKNSYDQALLDKNIDILSELNAYLSEKDITSTYLSIFSSYMYQQALLPSNHHNYDELEILKQLNEKLKHSNIVNSYDNLIKHKDESIYFKTDHHWTQLGAYYAYEMLGAVYGYEPIKLSAFEKKVSDNPFYGTLFSKAPLLLNNGDEMFTLELDKDYEVYIKDDNKTYDNMYFYENYDKKDQYVTFLDGNHGYVSIKSGNTNGRKLVMFKDSYAHALAPLLANHFEEVILIDMRYYKAPIKEFLEINNISDVLYSYNVSWFAEDNNLINLKK